MATSMFSSIPNEFPVKRKDLWTLQFPPEMNISERFEVEAERPKFNNSVKEIKYKNFEFKYKGSFKVEDMKIDFRDVVGPSVIQKLWAWQRQHNDPITGCGAYPSIYKKTLTLLLEDECGNAVEKWFLYGCILKSFDGGNLDMNSDADPVITSITISYDLPSLEY